jgi:hypothetical protein
LYILCRMMIFRPAIISTRINIRLYYERVFPYLVNKKVAACYRSEELEFVCLPNESDDSLIYSVMEAVRYLTKQTLIKQTLSESTSDTVAASTDAVIPYGHTLIVQCLIKWGMLLTIEADIAQKDAISELEMSAIKFGVEAITRDIGNAVAGNATYIQHLIRRSIDGTLNTPDYSLNDLDKSGCLFNSEQLNSILATAKRVEHYLKVNDPLRFRLPRINFDHSDEVEEIHNTGAWPLFGRLRRDVDVDDLAGATPVQPIVRPIEMTIVPESVETIPDVAMVSELVNW